MNKNIETSLWPTAEFKYFLYSPNDGITFFKSSSDRDAHAEDEIDIYLDDTWNEEVEGVCAGMVTHTAKEFNRKEKPTDPNELEEANWPHGVDYICEYKLLPLSAEGEPG